MVTLEQVDSTFETNANSTGLQRFDMVKRGTTPDNKNVYIYRRTYSTGPQTGRVFGYEVFIAKFVKAGTVQKFPNGVEKLIEQDTEIYPTKTDFGKRAWFCSLERAESRFAELTSKPIGETDATNEENETDIESTQGVRTRTKTDRPMLTLPVTEFSVKEVAEQNKVEYITASIFVKEMEASGKIKATRKERRAAKGRETQLFVPV